MLIRCGMKLLVVLKKWLKKYSINLKDVNDRQRRFGSGIRRFNQHLDERERERERSLTRCRDNVVWGAGY